MTTRARVIYHGNVQGVGFRYTARAVARRYAVSGFVRNLTNGTVELVAEGEEREVRSYLEDLQGYMGAFIGSQDLSFQEPLGEFEGFTVRF
ncbi:MAG: hypothetical protein AMK75_04290 [Planctomycetes bacterium SM23_65]|nr:MAG: hypothetical protein AMK75_04290 [Planctomycetes bacterium SM23_65]